MAMAQTVVYSQSAILTWDAITGKASGVPLATGDVVTYQISAAFMPVTNRTTPPVLAEVSAVSTPIAIPADGKSYAIAVRSKIVTDGGSTVLYSPWVWTDTDGFPSPFVLRAPSADSPVAPTRVRLGT